MNRIRFGGRVTGRSTHLVVHGRVVMNHRSIGGVREHLPMRYHVVSELPTRVMVLVTHTHASFVPLPNFGKFGLRKNIGTNFGFGLSRRHPRFVFSSPDNSHFTTMPAITDRTPAHTRDSSPSSFTKVSIVNGISLRTTVLVGSHFPNKFTFCSSFRFLTSRRSTPNKRSTHSNIHSENTTCLLEEKQ